MSDLSLLSKSLKRVLGDRQVRLTNKTIIRSPLRIIIVTLTFFLSLTSVQMAWGEDNKVYFQIPPSTADKALNLFALQADIQLLYPYDIVKELQLEGLSGEYSVIEGIKTLVANTCLEIVSSTNEKLTLNANNKGFWFMTSPSCKRKGLMSALSAALLASISATNSQEVGTEGTAHPRTIEEVVVTAQKRTQSSQDVPISMAALPTSQLEGMGITGTDSLRFAVPGLQIDRRASAAEIHIRGIGSAITNAGGEPSVAMYVDDVYNPSPLATVLNFNNIERIEVMKGPQGTLFGRNATGGVVHIITKNPEKDPSLDFEIGYGNYDTVESKIYATTGISSNIDADVAIYYKDRTEGFIKNQFDNEKYGKEEDLSLRSKWIISPSQNTEISLIGTYRDARNELGVYRQPVKGTLGQIGNPYTGDFYTVNMDYPGFSEQEFWSLSARIDHSFSAFDLTSITAYQDSAVLNQIETDSTAASLVNGRLNVNIETSSQEFQFKSNTEQSFSWILGLYLYESKASFAPLRLTGNGIPVAAVDVFSYHTSTSYAAFTDLNWQLTDRTDFTLGLRYTYDDIEIKGQTRLHPLPSTSWPPYYRESFTSDEPTWRVVLDHDLTDNIMLFASYSRGYKSGLFNTVVSSGVPAPPVLPEIVDAYEIGFKSEFLERRLQVNGAIYRNEAQDLQVFTNVPAGVILSNAAEAEINGLELDIMALATDNLDLNFSVSLMDSEYTKFPNTQLFPPLPSGGNDGTVYGDVSGNEVTRAPNFSMNVGVGYRIPLSTGELRPSINFHFNDGYYWEPNNTIKEPSLNMLSAEIRFSSINEKFTARLWGRNLLDEQYSIYTASSASGDLYSPGIPREYGIAIGFSF